MRKSANNHEPYYGTNQEENTTLRYEPKRHFILFVFIFSSRLSYQFLSLYFFGFGFLVKRCRERFFEVRAFSFQFWWRESPFGYSRFWWEEEILTPHSFHFWKYVFSFVCGYALSLFFGKLNWPGSSSAIWITPIHFCGTHFLFFFG